MAFTAKELQDALDKVQTIDRDFPELPIEFRGEYEEFWSKEFFPIVLKQVGDEKRVTVHVEEFIGGDEAGAMSIILRVGYGDNARYFQKNGFYDSWDNGNDGYQWDGGFSEVESKVVTVTQWVHKS